MVRNAKYLLLTSTAVVALAATAAPVMAAPEGGTVVGGSATISQSGHKTDIHQQSQRAILDWRSFDITAQEHVEFHQPSSSAIALNRINDTKPSRIDGRLTANGNVMLINPNGVVFGASSQVDVGSLTATTADIQNDDFMAGGTLEFNKAGRVDASIINHGSITAKDAGLVNLVAPHVENHGVINARLGKVQLAAADTFTLDMAGDGLLQVAVTDEQARKIARNTGRITAEEGRVAITATQARSIVDSLVEHSGIIEARSMTKKGGKVVLGGSHTKVSGTINVDGQTGGGDILVGGGFQGQKIENVTMSQVTEVTNTSLISANATDTGDGGEVIIWADKATLYEGEIESKGGETSGNGGFVEVSGREYLEYAGDVDLSGDELGTLLLDPDDIDIVAGVANPPEFDGDFIEFAESDSGATSTIGADTISGRLTSNANVILQANNTIDVNAAITSTGSGDLTLQTGAGGTITVNNAIDVNTGNLTLLGDEIDILANLSGSGNIHLNSADAAQEIEIGSTDAGDLNLTAVELANLTNGWNSITIGGTDHEARIAVNEAVSFSDHTILRTKYDWTLDRPIDINATVTTTDDSDLTLYGMGNNILSAHGYYGLHVGADLNVARDLYYYGGPNTGFFTNSVTVGRDMIGLGAPVHTAFDTNLTIGRNFTQSFNGSNLTLYAARTMSVGGDASFLSLTSPSTSFRMQANSNLQVDGDIIIQSQRIELDPTGSISGNADGSSNLIFREAGQNEAMELGGSSAAHNWQMVNAELDTIQDGFNSITFGSTTQGADIIITDDVTFSDSTTFIVNTGTIDVDAQITMTDAANLTFLGQEIDLSAAIGGTGDLRLSTSDITQEIEIGSLDAADLNLTAVELANLTNGWNSITIGGTDHEAKIAVNEAITFSDDTFLRTNNSQQNRDRPVDVNANITTIDGADLSIYGMGQGGASVHSFYGIHLDGELDVAGDILFDSRYRFRNNVAVTAGGTITFNDLAHTEINGNMTSGGDFIYDGRAHHFRLEDGHSIIVGGALQLTKQQNNTTLQLYANSSVQADGDLLFDFERIEIDPTVTISGNVDGSSNVTFLETGGNEDMEFGGSTAGHDWQMSTAEVATLQDGFNSITFGSATHRGAIFFSDDVSFSDDVIFRQDQVNANAGIDKENAAVFTTTDSANISMYADNSFSSMLNVRLNVAGDALFDGFSRTVMATSSVDGNLTIDALNDFGLHSNTVLSVGGDLNSSGNEFLMGLTLASTLNVDGNINISSNEVNIFTGSTINGNADGSSNLTFRELGNDAAMELGGTAVGSVWQMEDFELAAIQDGFNTVTFGEASATNDISIQSWDMSALSHDLVLHGGAITADDLITGTNAITINAATGDITLISNTNLEYRDAAFTTQGGDIILNADRDGNQNGAIELIDSGMTTNGGDFIAGGGLNPITISAFGSATNNQGIELNNVEISTGIGQISLRGHGRENNANGSRHGVHALNGTTLLTSTGDITIHGQGGAGTDLNNGIFISASDITSTDGNILLTGIGGNGSDNDNYGIQISSGSITSNGTGANAGTITLDGTGGDGVAGNTGIYLDNGDLISTDGNITLTGNGGDGSTTGNSGIVFTNGSNIESLGIGGDAATISLTGQGGAGTSSNMGISSGSSATFIRSRDGNITLDGTGGNGSGINNVGVNLAAGSTDIIISTGTGADAANIVVNGTGGDGTTTNYGLVIDGRGIAAVDGNITLTGTGGDGSGEENYGIYLLNGAEIESTGQIADTGFAGTITLTGTGGDGTTDNHGIYLYNDTTTITSTDGNILLGGTGGVNASGNTNRGVYFFEGADILSAGTTDDAATITVNAVAGANNAADAFLLNGGSIRSGYGDITISGEAGVNTTRARGIFLSNFNSGVAEAVIESTGTDGAYSAANIDIDGDAIEYEGIFMHVNATINTTDGDINIDGVGQHGLTLRFGGNINSLGNTSNAGNITINATASNGTTDRVGMELLHSSYITAVNGGIDITALGGDSTNNESHGLVLGEAGNADSYIQTTGAGNITIDATAGDCTLGNCHGLFLREGTNGEARIRTASTGNLNLTGRGGNTGSDNYGIFVEGGSYVESTSTGANAGTITLDGTGGNGVDNNHGVYLTDGTTRIETIDGAISITGQGGNGNNNNYGIYVNNGASVTSTGEIASTGYAGTITLDGTSGTGTDDNYGIYFETGNVTSEDGHVVIGGTSQGTGNNNYGIQMRVNSNLDSGNANLTMTGTGGSGNIRNDGVFLRATDITAQNGDISITGTGRGSGNDNSGILIRSNSTIISTGTGANAGTITLDGTGGNGADDNYGVYLSDDDTRIETIDGAISITGQGGNGNNNNYGIFVETGVDIVSTGEIANTGYAGTITLDGTGGDGADNNYGVYLTGSATNLTSTDGNIRITGRGQGSGNDNYGIRLESADVLSQGNTANGAAITLIGAGGNGFSRNNGVLLSSNANIRSAATGANAQAVSITATAGDGAGANNIGLALTNGSDSITSVDSDIVINATGNGTSGGGYGMSLRHGHIASTGDGDIIVTATASNSGNNNIGLWAERWNSPYNAEIVSHNGNIEITAIGGANAGSGNHGVFLSDTTNGGGGPTTFKTTGSGNMTITASSGPDPSVYDLYMQDDLGRTGVSGVGDSTMTGNILINIDSFYSENAAFIETQGNLTISNRTAGTTIGLGGGAGVLNITDAELAQFTVGGGLNIGAANTGAMHLDSVDFTGVTANNVTLRADSFVIDSDVDAGASLSLFTENDITLNGSVSATGAGNSLVMVGDAFNNTGGASAIDAGAGRYLVYLDSFSATTRDGLNASNLYGRAYADHLPASVTETGDLFLFANRPTLTFTGDDILLRRFDPNFSNFTYTTSGLQDGDTLSSVFSGAPAFTRSRRSLGQFNINLDEGTLSSLIGYQFEFVSGTLTMLSPSQQLSSTVEIQMQSDIWQGSNTSVNSLIQANDTTSQTSSTEIEPNTQGGRRSIYAQKKSGVRLVEADLLEIDKPIIDFYDLCSYNVQYCQ